ncbi:MAG: hypothetical protein HYS44_00425 [Candidatus Niyogibacteria bacterium]|nr:hypothetical protein [Candidatus Niyogibacteria bacterium]
MREILTRFPFPSLPPVFRTAILGGAKAWFLPQAGFRAESIVPARAAGARERPVPLGEWVGAKFSDR